ncbi:Rha family transcriptional regulator [Xenorhabdus bovienii]|nr:Rha family transcriptional regulator [Xenorhabdus bovienii]
MKILAPATQAVTMSSREIAELVNKNHKDVCRDIRVMLVGLYGGDEADYIRSANLRYDTNQGVICQQYDKNNPNGWEFLLDRRHTEILITGYDVQRRAAVIDRWFALESGSAQPQLSEMEMIAAIASNAACNEKRISAVEQKVEHMEQGTIPVGYQGYSYLQATYGLSNAKSKQLVMAWSVPHKKVPHVAPGGQVTQMSVVLEESFGEALHQMMKEAEQRGSWWYHPKMGRFSITGWKDAA